MMNRQQKRLIGLGSIMVLVIAVWVGIRYLPENEVVIEVIPPALSNISATYVTSTNEVIIVWQVDNIEVSPLNTGIRYDTVSNGTTTATSESYPLVKFSKLTDEGFEVRIPITSEDELFYRIQLAHDNEFLWSDEGNILILE